jgi:hypothetical protein
MKSKTITATQTEKLISVSVEDGEIICKGRTIVDINGRKIRGPSEDMTISKWPIEIDGIKYKRNDILNLLQAIYEVSVNA